MDDRIDIQFVSLFLVNILYITTYYGAGRLHCTVNYALYMFLSTYRMTKYKRPFGPFHRTCTLPN